MARPTGGALTGAGFTNTSGSQYAKTATASKAVVDITGNATQGFVQVITTTPGTPVSNADWTTHIGLLGGLGITMPKAEDLQGLMSYSGTL